MVEPGLQDVADARWGKESGPEALIKRYKEDDNAVPEGPSEAQWDVS